MTENHIPEPEAAITLRPDDLDELLTRAAERGAERCLAHLGLENGHAARDIRELRDLLEAWREARHTAWQTIIKVATTGLLAVILVGAAILAKVERDEWPEAKLLALLDTTLTRADDRALFGLPIRTELDQSPAQD